MNGGFFPMNGDGGQGEAVRVPLAGTTLVTVPGPFSVELLRSNAPRAALLKLAVKVAVGTSTSSPGPTPTWSKARWRAAVPDERATA